MTRRTRWLLPAVLCVCAASLRAMAPGPAAPSTRHTLDFGGHSRSYLLHVPAGLRGFLAAYPEGIGKSWPGGPQDAPESLIGGVCRDFQATESIREFFRTHPKPGTPG